MEPSSPLIPEHRSVLLNRYYSGDRIRRMFSPGNVERIGDRRGTYRVLVGKPKGKSLLGRPRLEYNINP